MKTPDPIATYPIKETVPDLRGGKKKLTAKQLHYLRCYAETLDEGQAAKDSGYRGAFEAMESEIICREMERIQEAWFHENRMNAKYCSGEHMRLMEKFETQYDKLDEEDKPKMASVLAKMSDTALKATGKMNNDQTGAGTTVLIQMNIGGVPQDVTVNAERA